MSGGPSSNTVVHGDVRAYDPRFEELDMIGSELEELEKLNEIIDEEEV